MKKSLFLGAALIILSLLVLQGCDQKTQISHAQTKPATQKVSQETQTAVIKENKSTTTTNAKFISYSEDVYNTLLGQKPFALFFHAEWCHTCTTLEKEIKANLDKFPQNTTILKVNFDTEEKLKIKYGIVSQSLITVLDKTGNVVDTLVAPDVNDLIASIKRSLI